MPHSKIAVHPLWLARLTLLSAVVLAAEALSFGQTPTLPHEVVPLKRVDPEEPGQLTVTVGTSPNAFPYSYVTKNGTVEGFAVELFDAVAKAVNLKTHRVIVSSVEMEQRFVNGEFDCIQLYAQTPERAAYADFSVPFLTFQGAILVRKYPSQVNSLQELEGKTFALVGTDSFAEKYIRKVGLKEIKVVYAKTPEEALRWVESEQVAATFLSRLTALTVIERDHFSNIVQIGGPLAEADLPRAMAVHKGNAILLARLNEGLAILYRTGEFDQIYRKWFGRFDRPPITREEIITYIAAGLGLVCIAAIWGMLHQRKLNQRIGDQALELTQKERFLRLLLENFPDYISRYDAECRFLYVSPSVVRTFGSSPEHFLGKTRSEVSSIDATRPDKELDEAVHRAFAEGIATTVAAGWTTVAGERFFELRYLPEKDETGKVTSVLCIGRDMTHQKQVEKSLRQREEEFRALVENSPDIISRFDRAGRYLYTNEAMKKISGITAQEVVGKRYGEVVAERAAPGAALDSILSIRALIEGAFRTGFPAEVEIEAPLADGVHRFDVRLIPERDETGNVVSVLHIGRDITERVRAAEALRASEVQLKEAQNLAQIGSWLWRPDGRLIWSETMFKLFGIPRDIDPTFDHFIAVVHPDERENVQRGFQEWISSAALHTEVEYRVLLPDRSIHTIVAIGNVERDPQGLPIRALGTCQDITERKRAEEQISRLNAELEQRVKDRTKALTESERRFRTIYDTAPVSIWEEDWREAILAVKKLRGQEIADLPGYFQANPNFVIQTRESVKILDGNQWTSEMFCARDKTELLSSLKAILGTSEDNREFEGELIALAKGETVYRKELTLQTLKGETLHGLVVMSFPPLEADSGNVLVSMVDITERKRAEKEIRTLNQNLRERAADLEVANRELETFSYSVSHDLRAPLRSIDGFSRILLVDYAQTLDAEGVDHLQTIRAASRRMGELIDDMLMLSKVTRQEIKRTEVDLSSQAAAIARELQKTNPDRRVEFVITPGMIAKTDARLMRIVYDNLLANAWKFTGLQTSARIEVGRTESEHGPTYFVADNGVGFESTFVHKLFVAFHRLHSAAEFPGTGIGLATVQRIINRLGGRLWAEGSVGKGATFYFTLPHFFDMRTPRDTSRDAD